MATATTQSTTHPTTHKQSKMATKHKQWIQPTTQDGGWWKE